MTPYETLDELLRGVEAPVTPVDGDCEPWSRRIDGELCQRGITCVVQPLLFSIRMLVGDKPTRVVVAGHTVVLVEGLTVVDFTARQFRLDLPARWIASLQDYRERMLGLFGAETMTLL